MKAVKSKMMVKAPDGYHWMSEKGRFHLMKHSGKFVPHEGASLEAPFRVKSTHG
jgi:hypothetical protein